MSKTLLSLAAATLMVAALAAAPAMAQTTAAPAPAATPAAPAPAAKATKHHAAHHAAHHAMHHAAHHKQSCYDYAWQSQAMQDCLAKGSAAATPAKKSSTHKAKKAMSPKKAS